MTETHNKKVSMRARSGGVDAERCMEKSVAIATRVQQQIYRFMLHGNLSAMRCLLTINNSGQPEIIQIPHDAIVGAIKDLPRLLSDPGCIQASNDDLTRIAHSCLERMANRLF